MVVGAVLVEAEYISKIQCPKNNLNICLKTEPITDEADATVYSNVWVSGQTYTVTIVGHR